MELDDVIRSVNRQEPMGPDELRRAAAVLRKHAPARTPGVLEAQLRVAVRLERLER